MAPFIYENGTKLLGAYRESAEAYRARNWLFDAFLQLGIRSTSQEAQLTSHVIPNADRSGCTKIKFARFLPNALSSIRCNLWPASLGMIRPRGLEVQKVVTLGLLSTQNPPELT